MAKQTFEISARVVRDTESDSTWGLGDPETVTDLPTLAGIDAMVGLGLLSVLTAQVADHVRIPYEEVLEALRRFGEEMLPHTPYETISDETYRIPAEEQGS